MVAVASMQVRARRIFLKRSPGIALVLVVAGKEVERPTPSNQFSRIWLGNLDKVPGNVNTIERGYREPCRIAVVQ